MSFDASFLLVFINIMYQFLCFYICINVNNGRLLESTLMHFWSLTELKQESWIKLVETEEFMSE